MSFNKTEYWKNRSEGKRGQGEYIVPTVAGEHKEGSHVAQVGGKLVRINRETARRKGPAARIFYGPEDKIGKKHTARGAVRQQFSHEHHLERVRERAAR